MGVGNGGDEGAGSGGEWWCVARCDRFAFAVDRSPRWWSGREACGGRARGRASDATHSRVAVAGHGAAALRAGGGPELGGAAGGEDAWLVILPSWASAASAWSSWPVGGCGAAGRADLGAGQPVGERVGERGVDLVGRAGRRSRAPAPRWLSGRVVPERERGGQVRRAGSGGGVEQGVDEREADRVRFSAGADRAGDPGLAAAASCW